MINATSNIIVFIVFVFLLLIEYAFLGMMDVPYAVVWMCTGALYFVFVVYQVMVKINEGMEKNKIKELLNEIFDAIYGIPLVNKEEKMIIKWDIVFKKLIDRNEHQLYEKIIHISTKKIDQYVNMYPSLLLNNTDVKENRYKKIDLNSVVLSNKSEKENDKNNKELVDEKELKTRLFIKEIGFTKALFTNFDSSIMVEVALNEVKEPYEEMLPTLKETDVVDGFTVFMFYNNNKYVVVPDVVLVNKRIDKEKWFWRNINKLLEIAGSITKGEKAYALNLEEKDLAEYSSDISLQEREKKLELVFHALDGESLVFKSINSDIGIMAFCELDTGYNSFELILKKIEKTVGGKKETVELQKTIAIGNSFQPLVTVLEKMLFITNNIKVVIDNKDLSDIVIK